MKLCLLTFSTAIFFSFALGLEHPDCRLKEDARCESFATAKSCDAFSYCLSNVWHKGTPKNTPCNKGQNVVKQLQLALTDERSNAPDWARFIQLCGALDAGLEHSCQVTLREGWPDVARLINSTVRPSDVANLLNLCELPAQPKSKGNICTDCKAFLTDIQDMVIGEHTEDMMQEKMADFCHQLPGTMSSLCLNLTDDWIKHFFQFLNDEMNFERICFVASLCPSEGVTVSETNKPSSLFENPITDITCNPCKEVMEEIKHIMYSPDFQFDIEFMLESAMCDLLPRHMITTCKQQVKKFASLVLDFILMEMDSETMCEAIRLCSAPANKKTSNFALFDTISSAIKSNYQKLLPFVQMLMPRASLNSECSMCQFFVREVTKVVSQQHSKDQILNAFDRLCDALPTPWSTQCKDFVNDNGDDIIDAIIHSLTPKEVCEAIGFCPPEMQRDQRDQASPIISMHQELKEIHKEHLKAAPRVSDSAWCKLCKDMADIINKLVTSKELSKALDTAEDAVCSIFPFGLGDKCRDMFDRLVEDILDSASTMTDPEFACGAIGVCEVQAIQKNKYDVTFNDVNSNV